MKLVYSDSFKDSVMTLHESKFTVFDMIDQKNIKTYSGYLLSPGELYLYLDQVQNPGSIYGVNNGRPFTITNNPWKADKNRILVLERVFSMVIDEFGKAKDFQHITLIGHCAQGQELIFPQITHPEAIKLNTNYFFLKCGKLIATIDSNTYGTRTELNVAEANPMEKSRVALIGMNYDHLIVPSYHESKNLFRVVKEAGTKGNEEMTISDSLTLSSQTKDKYRAGRQLPRTKYAFYLTESDRGLTPPKAGNILIDLMIFEYETELKLIKILEYGWVDTELNFFNTPVLLEPSKGHVLFYTNSKKFLHLFMLEGYQTSPPSGCLDSEYLDDSSQVCISCAASIGKCLKCKYQGVGPVCTECENRFTPKDGNCFCQKGFIFEGKGCKPCVEYISGCSSCSEDPSITYGVGCDADGCEQGYIYDKHKDEIKCLEDCGKKNMAWAKDNTCLDCKKFGENCTECDDKVGCTKCDHD